MPRLKGRAGKTQWWEALLLDAGLYEASSWYQSSLACERYCCAVSISTSSSSAAAALATEQVVLSSTNIALVHACICSVLPHPSTAGDITSSSLCSPSSGRAIPRQQYLRKDGAEKSSPSNGPSCCISALAAFYARSEVVLTAILTAIQRSKTGELVSACSRVVCIYRSAGTLPDKNVLCSVQTKLPSMAGEAPNAYDARAYDTKMQDL